MHIAVLHVQNLYNRRACIFIKRQQHLVDTDHFWKESEIDKSHSMNDIAKWTVY
jgi:hypothetical protein